MKIILKMTLACVLSLSFMTLVSCGSKVNQKELNEKIEKAIENEKVLEASFTDEEYDFMAKYFLDHYSEIMGNELDDPKDQIILNYMMILSLAQSDNKLKGNAKKDYEESNKKIRSMLYGESPTPDSYDESAEVVVEEMADDSYDSDTLGY